MGNLTHIGLAGSFGALLVGWSVVVVRELYLARHLFTLLHLILFILLVVAKYVGIKLLEMLLAVME